jgi:hypothetical protein
MLVAGLDSKGRILRGFFSLEGTANVPQFMLKQADYWLS